jgi:hypothetical protein
MTGRQLLQIVQIDCERIPFQVRVGNDRSSRVASGIKLGVPVPRYLIAIRSRMAGGEMRWHFLRRGNHYRNDYRTADLAQKISS